MADNKYPEHEKMRAVKVESQAIGTFLDMSGYSLCELAKIECADCGERVDQYWPLGKSIDKILAEYFDIDLGKIEEEKRAMLDEIRAANAKREEQKL